MTKSKTPESITDGMGWQEAASLAIRAGVAVYLYGPPGTGKSYWARTHALIERYGMRQGVQTINCTPDALGVEARGAVLPMPGSGDWGWVDGPILRAMRGRMADTIVTRRLADRLVVEELPRAGEDLQAFLLAAADNAKTCGITIPNTGELVRPAEGFSIVATGNSPPEELFPALADRFLCIEVQEPSAVAFEAVPAAYRDAAMIETREGRTSLREWLRFSQLLSARQGESEEAVLRLVLDERAGSIYDAVKLTAGVDR